MAVDTTRRPHYEKRCSVKLNVGAGKRRIPGYTGVDAVQREGADIVAPADNIPLADGCATEILAIHLIEHLYAWQVPGLLKEWYRLLSPGGRLVLELPDLKKCAKNLLSPRPEKTPGQLSMFGIYGDHTLKDPWMMHKAGWWFESLAPVVAAAGFVEICECQTVYHPVGRGIRDFRLEARRP